MDIWRRKRENGKELNWRTNKKQKTSYSIAQRIRNKMEKNYFQSCLCIVYLLII